MIVMEPCYYGFDFFAHTSIHPAHVRAFDLALYIIALYFTARSISAREIEELRNCTIRNPACGFDAQRISARSVSMRKQCNACKVNCSYDYRSRII